MKRKVVTSFVITLMLVAIFATMALAVSGSCTIAGYGNRGVTCTSTCIQSGANIRGVVGLYDSNGNFYGSGSGTGTGRAAATYTQIGLPSGKYQARGTWSYVLNGQTYSYTNSSSWYTIP